MSFVHIILQVWSSGALMLRSFIKESLGPKTISRSEKFGTILLTSKFKDPFDPELAPLPVSDGRHRPEWLARGFVPLNEYEDHTGDFPSYDMQDPAAEIEAMNAAHTYAFLLPPPTPIFAPSTAPINTRGAFCAAKERTADIFYHKEEAYDALSVALKIVCGKPRSKYQMTHPAFTAPRQSPNAPCSPVIGTITRYIEHTFRQCSHSIRVVPPPQMRWELEACLMLAFAPYVHSDAFCNEDGKNKIIPEDLADLVDEALQNDFVCLNRTRDVLELCDEYEIEGGDELLEIYEAWKRVARCFIGLLVLRHEARSEEIAWD